MLNNKLNKLRLQILSDKTITGISNNPLSITPGKEIILKREVKQTYSPENYNNWNDIK